jgi:thiamine pyridinylase
MRTVRILLCSAGLLVAGCTLPLSDENFASPSSRVAPKSDRFVLRVSLFPWIPEKESFARWIESEFERQNPSIDLLVRPMNAAETAAGDLSYDHEATVRALSEPQNPDRQDLVEIDTIILGKLVKAQAVQTVSLNLKDYYDFARRAVTIDGKVYGVPHWSCGYFVMTTDSSVAEATTGQQLKIALEGLGTASPDLGGDLIGSWGSVTTYADAFVDSYPEGNLQAALASPTLDPGVGASLAAVGSACNSSGVNFCNRDDDDLVKQFGAKHLDALIGYSERLNPLLSNHENLRLRDQIRITPAPLGSGKTAFLFTDALVRSPNCNSARCQDAAQRFSVFYSSAIIMAKSMMSADKGSGAVPRYLLSSNRSAMRHHDVRRDPLYRQLTPLMALAHSYPNQGIPEARAAGEIRKAVDVLLQPAVP